MANVNPITITRNLKNEKPELNHLISTIATACKHIAAAVRSAGLSNMQGLASVVNASGDDVQKLDVISNDIFINILKESGCSISAMVSEENENAIIVNNGKYLVCFDPLDGSGNIDCLVAIGTIFSIFELKSDPNNINENCLLPGKDMVAAGYTIYGSATCMVLSTGNAPDLYMLDQVVGDFILTSEKMSIKSKGKYYSLNEGYTQFWDKPTKEYIDQCKFGQKPDPKKPMVCRYIGSLVADFHRTLLYGGIFMNPGHNNASGKLRLKLRYLYEVAPMAFIIEKAGGIATTGSGRLLDLVPTDIHMRVPITMGSRENVEDFIKVVEKYGNDHLQGTKFM